MSVQDGQHRPEAKELVTKINELHFVQEDVQRLMRAALLPLIKRVRARKRLNEKHQRAFAHEAEHQGVTVATLLAEIRAESDNEKLMLAWRARSEARIEAQQKLGLVGDPWPEIRRTLGQDPIA